MNEQIEFIKLIVSRLDSAGIAYMITGSMAMAIYGVPRMTRDIDLVVEVDVADTDKLVNLFSPDCYLEKEVVREAIFSRTMFNIIHTEWAIKADFIIRKEDEYRNEEFGRKQEVAFEETTVLVVSVENLILSKLVWGRRSESEVQMRDVRQLLESVAELDRKYLEKWSIVLKVNHLLKETEKDV